MMDREPMQHHPDNEPTQPERKKTWLTEGILIASIPVVAYILMALFLIGYCDFFSIPVSFVSLNLSTMLWIGLRLELGILLLFVFTAPMYWILTFYKNKTTKIMLLLLPLPYIGVVALEIAQGLPWRDWRGSLFALIPPILFALMAPNRPISTSTSKVVWTVVLLFTGLGASFSLAMNMGRAVAAKQRDYLIPVAAPTTVVLSYFGERLIVAPFDRSTKEVDQSFSVIKIGEDPKLVLRWESVGPLHPKPDRGPSTPAPATK